MEKVPRHLFVDGALGQRSYGDYALPIGAGQTISQPYTIGLTTWALDLKDGDKVLEVGTGSGYQSAILAEIAGQVFSIEKVADVARRARRVLDQLGYLNIAIRIMDGFYGWKEESPFDAILVSAATPSMPWTLLEQLKLGGKLVMPVQEQTGQQLVQLERQVNGCRKQVLGPCRFVPLKSSHPG
jgi:protein-L-isoaspartate(D-aspartate) O-methyltransferase